MRARILSSAPSRYGPALALVAGFLLVTTTGPLADDSISDLFVYQRYADGVLDGARPYAQLGFEYPPLALGPLVLPGVGAPDAAGYELRFGALMLLAALVVQAAVALLAGRRGAWLCAALPLLAGALLRTRFDLVPVALLLVGLVLVVRARPVVGMAVLGAGTATKLFPVIAAVMVVVWLLAAGRRRAARDGILAFGAVLAVTCLPFTGDGFLDQFRFHLERPVQIESTPASVLWLAGGSEVTGHPVRPDRFKSNGLDGGAADVVALLFAFALAMAVGVITALLQRAGPSAEALQRAVFAGLLAFVALGKVLSPQYLIWLLPLAALAWLRGDRSAAALVAGAAVLTQIAFPRTYFDLVAADTAAVALIVARNALLLAALALAMRALARTREGGTTARGSARSRRRGAVPST